MILPRTALAVIGVSALLLSGCARPASTVRPVPVSSLQFSDLSCTDLAQRINQTFHDRKALEKRQTNAVIADAATFYVAYVPPSVLTGDPEQQLAQTRGTEVALRRAHQVQCR